MAIIPSLYPNLSVDLIKDFAPISQVALSASMLAVQCNLNAKTVQELVTLAKASPGKLSYGTGGRKTSSGCSWPRSKSELDEHLLCESTSDALVQ